MTTVELLEYCKNVRMTDIFTTLLNQQTKKKFFSRRVVVVAETSNAYVRTHIFG
jgi:hypothetical protein